MASLRSTARGAAWLALLSTLSACTLFAPDSNEVRGAQQLPDGRFVLLVQREGPADEAGDSDFRGLYRLTLDPASDAVDCRVLRGAEGSPLGLGAAHVVTDRELVIADGLGAVEWIGPGEGESGTIDATTSSPFAALTAAWTGADGDGRVMTTTGIHRVTPTGEVTTVATMASSSMWSGIFAFVPEDDLRGVALHCQGGASPIESLAQVDCSSGECLVAAPGAVQTGRCADGDGRLLRDAAGSAAFVEAVASAPGVGPTAIAVTTLAGETTRIEDVNTQHLAATAREGGGLVVVSLTYADTLESFFVAPDGTIEDAVPLGRHDDTTFIEDFGVVATGIGSNEEVRVYVGVDDRIREIMVVRATGAITERELALCE